MNYECVNLTLKWTPEEKRGKIDQEQHGGELLKIKGTQRHGPHLGGGGKEGQEQKRMEISSSCTMCLRVQQGLDI